MTQHDQDQPSRLYLCVPAGPETSTVVERISPLLDTGDVASLLITRAGENDIEPQNALALCEAAKARSVPVLVLDDAQLARTIKADGVHVAWRDNIKAVYDESREIVGGQAIVGADAGRSRHDAMCLAEAGADYVAFGIPAHVSDINKAQDRQQNLTQWWSDIFQIPSVAFNVTDFNQAKVLAANGADFIAMELPVGLSGAQLKTWFETCLETLATPAIFETVSVNDDIKNS